MTAVATSERLLLTTDEVAALLGLSPRLVREMGERGELPGRRACGRVLRWSRIAIESWATQNHTTHERD